MSIGVLGGLLLIIGAFFTYKGKIFTSVFIYFFADIMWCVLAFNAGDFIGVAMISVGMLLGLGAFLKMHFGEMRKTLDN